MSEVKCPSCGAVGVISEAIVRRKVNGETVELKAEAVMCLPENCGMGYITAKGASEVEQELAKLRGESNGSK